MQVNQPNLSFTPIFKHATELYKKHFIIISAFMLIPSAFSLILEYFFPSEPTIGSQTLYSVSARTLTTETAAIGLVVGVLALFFSYIGYAASLRYISAKTKLSFADTIQQVTGTIREAIILTIRIFIYTYAWVIIAAMILIGLISMLDGAAAGLIPIIAIGALVMIVILIGRILSVTFAFPIFLTEEGMEGEKALQQSLLITKGHIATIFVNYLLLGIIAAITAYIYGLIILPFIDPIAITNSSLLVTALFLPLQIIFSGISVLFTYAFMLKAQGK